MLNRLAGVPAEFWAILLASGIWLLVGFLLAGVVHALVPMAWVRRRLGGRGLRPVATAAALGLPMPLCSCSVIPVAASLRRAGAGRGATAAFTISTPQTGEESIPLTWALFGPAFALARPLVAIATGFTAGMLIDALAPDREEGLEGADETGGRQGSPVPRGKPCRGPSEPACREGPTEPTEQRTLGGKVREALRYAFVTLPADLAPWLIAGLVLAAVIAALLPAGWLGERLGPAWVQMLLALVVGVPVYVCATSSTPLAFSLVAAGMSPGAALVLLLAGPATNTATIAWALRDLGGKALAIYLATIAAFAYGAGLLFEALLGGMVRLAETGGVHEHEAGVLEVVGAVGLAALLVGGLVPRLFKRRAAEKACCASAR